MKKNKEYQKELFKRLSKNQGLKRIKTILKQLFKKPLFWLVEATAANELTPLNGSAVCQRAKGDVKETCLKRFNQVINRAKKSRSLERFVCAKHCYGLVLPLVQGDALYGFLIICNLDTLPSEESLRLFEVFNSEILEKVQKELELSKLYQAIRPRAIALSTVHTIHRLISSSLNLEELLPRIARLTLQVLRVKQCLISLVDKETKQQLVPKAFINSNKKGENLRPPASMRKIESKVMRTGNIQIKKSYLSVPLIDEELIGVITVFKKLAKRPFNNFDREILMALSEQAVGAIKNAQLYKEQENMLLGTVRSLSGLLKTKSAYPYAHSKIFVDIVLGIAKKLGGSEEELRNLRFAAMLHDAEKFGIPEKILKKPTALTGKELKIIKEHPRKGVQVLSPLKRLKPSVEIILHHHENFNGTGYPDRLKREKIPLGARIMAVADSFEAMISRRPYRKSTTVAEAIKEIKRQSGTQFDPKIVKAFLKLAKSKTFKKLLKKSIQYGRPKKNL